MLSSCLKTQEDFLAAFDPTEYHCERCTPSFLLELLHWYFTRARCMPRHPRHYLPQLPRHHPHPPDPKPPSSFLLRLFESSRPPPIPAEQSIRRVSRTHHDLKILQKRLAVHASTIILRHFPAPGIPRWRYPHSFWTLFGCQLLDRVPDHRIQDIDIAKARLRGAFAALEWVDEVEWMVKMELCSLHCHYEGYEGVIWAWGEGGREKEIRRVMKEMSWLTPEGEEMMPGWKKRVADPGLSESKPESGCCPKL